MEAGKEEGGQQGEIGSGEFLRPELTRLSE